MEKKRKRTTEEERERILRKIRKLQEEAQLLPDTDPEDNDTNNLFEEDMENFPPEEDEYLQEFGDTTEDKQNEMDNTKESGELSEEEIEDEILEILGAAPAEKVKPLTLRKVIAERWMEILEKGLTKEDKESILKKYPSFENCDRMVAPLLNPEVGTALAAPAKKRDNIIETRQKQLSAVLSGLGGALQLCVSTKGDSVNKKEITEKISDASRLLCDSLFRETRGRRALILSCVNSSLKPFLLETDPRKYLFGDNLTEKIKTAKTVQRSGQELKIPEIKKYNQNPKTHPESRRNNPSSSRTLNWRGLPRPSTRGTRTWGQQGRPQYTQQKDTYKKKEERPAYRRK